MSVFPEDIITLYISVLILVHYDVIMINVVCIRHIDEEKVVRHEQYQS